MLGVLGAVVFVAAKTTVSLLVREAKADDVEASLPAPARALLDELRAKGHYAEYAAWANRIPASEVADSVRRAILRGIPYMRPEDVKRHATLQVHLFSAMPTTSCARLSRGTPSVRDTGVVYAALRDLGPLAETEQGVLSARAIIAAKLEGRMWPGPNPDDVAEGLLYAIDNVPTLDAPRFVQALNNMNAVSDDDACWAQIEMYRLAPSLPDSIGVPYLRGLAVAIYAAQLGPGDN
jgi:hypothetical protein